MFFETDEQRMEAFIKLSHIGGSRADYVQGGGGNTSVKLKNGQMAIKASGYCLKDIEKDNGYAVLDGNALRKFYREHNPEDFEDCEAAGAQCAKDNIQVVEGLPTLRPSVEAGFHSILKTYVLHTHSVFANLAACTIGGREVAKKAFQYAPYTWGWVDYQDPGAKLAFAIRDELDRVEKETGRVPAVIIMQNHGITVHDDDAVSCLAIHADANVRLAAHYGLAENTFPRVTITELAGGVYRATTPYLQEKLENCMLHEAGIRNYTIWNVGNELFGYYECDSIRVASEVQAGSEINAKWDAYMKDVMVMEKDPVTGAQPLLKQVFYFD